MMRARPRPPACVFARMMCEDRWSQAHLLHLRTRPRRRLFQSGHFNSYDAAQPSTGTFASAARSACLPHLRLGVGRRVAWGNRTRVPQNDCDRPVTPLVPSMSVTFCYQLRVACLLAASDAVPVTRWLPPRWPAGGEAVKVGLMPHAQLNPVPPTGSRKTTGYDGLIWDGTVIARTTGLRRSPAEPAPIRPA